MDNFKIIYKILRILEKSMDIEEFDKSSISKERLELSEARWCRIMALIVEEGYVKGVRVWNIFAGKTPSVEIISPYITLRGLEYLEENTFMKNAAKAMLEI